MHLVAGFFCLYNGCTMTLLVSKFGKYVDVADQKREDELILEGFQRVSPQQEAEYRRERLELINKMTHPTDTEKGIYFATVSPGGKDGYGMASTNLLRELDTLGVQCQTQYSGQKVAILFHNPYGLPRLESPYRIIYTMFESDKIPDDWKDYLEAADEVWVPTQWCADVFAKAGVTARVMPLGYNDKVFKFIERKSPEEQKRPFTFLHYNAFNLRKGFTEVFKAFNQAFEKTDNVKMIFKSVLPHAPLPITPSEYPNIEIILGRSTEEELAELCGKADAFVFPSRGEGFGLTPLEAMATGLPTIVPNAHGISEYFNPDFMYEAEVEEMVPATYARYKGIDVGKMVKCSVDQLAKQMQWVYHHHTESMKKGKEASEYVKKWTYKTAAENIKKRIEEIQSTPIEGKKHTNVLTLQKVK